MISASMAVRQESGFREASVVLGATVILEPVNYLVTPSILTKTL